MRIAFGLALLATTGLAAPTLSAQTATEPRSLPVGTCINMGNSLEPEQEGSWGGSNIDAADFERIAAAGFDTVRIPVRWHNKSQSEAPYTVDSEWMARVVEVVDAALAADLNVILNSHHFDPIHEDPAGVAAWHGGGFLAMVHAMLAIRDLPPAQKEAWRGWFDHFVFGEDAAEASAHLPSHARGVTGPASPQRDEKIRRYVQQVLAGG